MAIMPLSKQIKFLNALGLPAKTAGQRKNSWIIFQQGSAWHHFDAKAKKVGPLKPDGVPGSATTAHVNASQAHYNRLSPHFALHEFKCRASGHTHVSIDRDMVYSLEKLRAKIGPITIVTGYRCRAYNTHVGGTRDSAHMDIPCRAADITPHPNPNTVKGLGFHGIGIRNTDHNVRTPMVVVHVDQQLKNKPDTVFIDA